MVKSIKVLPTIQNNYRSTCPVNYALETFGDKWSLLIIRDIVRHHKCYYSEFLNSEEQISTNILANRLNRLEQVGILKRTPDKSDKRKDKYKLTQKGIDLFPIMLEIILWATKYNSEVDEYYKTMLPLIKADKQTYINNRLEEISNFSNSD